MLKARAIENIASTLEKTNTPNALAIYQKAIELETETGNKAAVGHTYEWMGNMYYYSLNKFDSAKRYFDLALKFYSGAGAKDQIANIYNGLGHMYYGLSNYSDAIKNFELSLKACKQTGNKHLMSDCYVWTANCQRVLGHYGDGIESAMNALKISREIKDTDQITSALEQAGYIYDAVKDYEEALKNYQAELNIFQLRQDSAGIASVYMDFGYFNYENGQFADALKYYSDAILILKKLNDYFKLYEVYLFLSLLYEKQGKYEETIENSKTSLQYAKLYGDKKFISIAYDDLAQKYMKASEADSALANYYEAFKVSTEFNLHKQSAFDCLGIGRVKLLQGKTTEAIDWLQKALGFTPPTEYLLLRNISQKLSEAYEKEHDFKNAFASQVKFKAFSDSLDSKEKAEKLATLTNQLEFENKKALQKASQDKTIALRESEISREKLVRNVSLAGLAVFIVFAVIFFVRFREKRKLNIALEKSLTELKSTQAQLIQSEKMASLGELTAGIAHEIQNPLNFVNNFSEVSNELIVEMKQELSKNNYEDVHAIADDIKQNLEKINHHGKRADAIVKGMLQHSRINTGKKEPTNINALADEYLRLSYHGLRAKDKTFTATLQTDFDNSIRKLNVVPQDIGRVLLNLFNNAFYTVNEKAKQNIKGFEPVISVSTKRVGSKTEIHVKDNGNGIPQKVLDKIFQPFFTTKPTGQGTGLGLSLSYDIIKAHGGEIRVETKEEEGSEFVVQLPIS